ncbi:MAG: hypothetical protein GY878_27150 [Fuerstiella sp.]|nr:hypothetical protein [Fuerstiella sp.]
MAATTGRPPMGESVLELSTTDHETWPTEHTGAQCTRRFIDQWQDSSSRNDVYHQQILMRADVLKTLF